MPAASVCEISSSALTYNGRSAPLGSCTLPPTSGTKAYRLVRKRQSSVGIVEAVLRERDGRQQQRSGQDGEGMGAGHVGHSRWDALFNARGVPIA